MTQEQIEMVEAFLKTANPEIEVLSIKTERNTDRGPKAPKFLTEIVVKDPAHKKPYVVKKNSLAVFRAMKQIARKPRAEA